MYSGEHSTALAVVVLAVVQWFFATGNSSVLELTRLTNLRRDGRL